MNESFDNGEEKKEEKQSFEKEYILIYNDGNKETVFETVDEIKSKNKSREKTSFPKGLILMMLVLTILVSTISSYVTAKLVLRNVENKTIVIEQPNQNTTSPTVITSDKIDISEVVNNIKDTIVEVYTESTKFSSFYGEYITEGAGSGVIYSSDGYIITNNHVVENATNITVVLTSKEQYKAQIVASDLVSDIAVLKIEAEGLKVATIGDSDQIKVGQMCIAIGNPLGTLGGTVTDGIISALSREITIEGQKMVLLQTNTAISPGNSGGGLFDIAGNLIGIVNAKSAGDYIEGIGFAIPVNYAIDVTKQLIAYGYVEGRPQLGIRGVSIETMQQAWSYSVNNFGVYVLEVIGESAKNAGLKIGDVIVKFDGEEIKSITDLRTVLCNYSAGDIVEIEVVRGQTTLTLILKLEQKK
ncbi:MAG: trypsin-like peptidase domain-containing protein [Bacillota bacterium]|jgi:serine protease Do|nr:trypsin-like peptidase domain-containing protein [Bacillota bacterium]NLL26438.1 trypsin-like serine protease [Erysipelotrichia bacterium]